MESRLQKWGNSTGIRIPNLMLKTLNLKNNDIVKIEQEDDRIIITKANKNKISLRERFEVFNKKNNPEKFEWDLPVGREIW